MPLLVAPRSARGFTLIELVVVIVLLAVLSAVAVARFVNLATAARIASVKSAYGAVSAAATGAAMQCRMTPGCFVADNAGIAMPTPDGGSLNFYYGAPPWYGIGRYFALDPLVLVQTSLSDVSFVNQDAPDPAHCLVHYVEAYVEPGVPVVTMDTSGC